MRVWKGSYSYLLWELVVKDFRIRYRNMSLGVFWSLLNPLVMMGIYTYIFTKIFVNPIPHFNIHVLSGLITFGFFSTALATATSSVVDNFSIIKRVPVRREIIPIASILSNLTHLLIQFLLLLVFVVGAGLPITWNYLWLPVLWALMIVFLIGLGLATSACNVFVRDTRYVVESFNLVLFWIVPIIYAFGQVPAEARDLYQFNPVAALILATHNIVLEGHAPSMVLVGKLAGVALTALAGGWLFFHRAERRFYDYL
jgi:ABC-type polysaccharide/polyol phosphate export permease